MTTDKRGRTRLFRCWENMKRRVRERGCGMCQTWKDFKVFEAWALSNGYADNLNICRNGDKGKYEPNNVRWDTQANNIEEAFAQHYQLCFKGKLVEVYNLRKFSLDNYLDPSCMAKVVKVSASHTKDGLNG